jgi:hypothetical protein
MKTQTHVKVWWLLPAALLGVFLAQASCSNSPATFGQSCSIYATDQACQKGLSCECETAGCYCVTSCDPLDAGCGTKAECVAGFRPAEGATGYFCFPPDGGP